MTSQLVIFRAFLFIFFRPPDPRSEKKNPVNQLIKKIWPYVWRFCVWSWICDRVLSRFCKYLTEEARELDLLDFFFLPYSACLCVSMFACVFLVVLDL